MWKLIILLIVTKQVLAFTIIRSNATSLSIRQMSADWGSPPNVNISYGTWPLIIFSHTVCPSWTGNIGNITDKVVMVPAYCCHCSGNFAGDCYFWDQANRLAPYYPRAIIIANVGAYDNNRNMYMSRPQERDDSSFNIPIISIAGHIYTLLIRESEEMNVNLDSTFEGVNDYGDIVGLNPSLYRDVCSALFHTDNNSMSAWGIIQLIVFTLFCMIMVLALILYLFNMRLVCPPRTDRVEQQPPIVQSSINNSTQPAEIHLQPPGEEAPNFIHSQQILFQPHFTRQSDTEPEIVRSQQVLSKQPVQGDSQPVTVRKVQVLTSSTSMSNFSPREDSVVRTEDIELKPL